MAETSFEHGKLVSLGLEVVCSDYGVEVCTLVERRGMKANHRLSCFSELLSWILYSRSCRKVEAFHIFFKSIFEAFVEVTPLESLKLLKLLSPILIQSCRRRSMGLDFNEAEARIPSVVPSLPCWPEKSG